MIKARIYGKEPRNTVLVHGGPGAAGELAPLAKEISLSIGVVEALQSKKAIPDLILELKEIIETHSDGPVQFVGYSWGAWLSFIFAALHPDMVRKLILLSSGPFDASYAPKIVETRLSRLSEEDKRLLESLEKQLSQSDANRGEVLLEYGTLMSKADSFSPISLKPNDEIHVDEEIYQSVWKEASKLRRSGELLKYGEKISCPVVVIHGDYDSHPIM